MNPRDAHSVTMRQASIAIRFSAYDDVVPYFAFGWLIAQGIIITMLTERLNVPMPPLSWNSHIDAKMEDEHAVVGATTRFIEIYWPTLCFVGES